MNPFSPSGWVYLFSKIPDHIPCKPYTIHRQGSASRQKKIRLVLSGGDFGHGQQAKAFANLTALAGGNPYLWQLTRRFMPEVSKTFEEIMREPFGFDFRRLTESEARYLTKQLNREDTDGVRDRIAASR